MKALNYSKYINKLKKKKKTTNQTYIRYKRFQYFHGDVISYPMTLFQINFPFLRFSTLITQLIL